MRSEIDNATGTIGTLSVQLSDLAEQLAMPQRRQLLAAVAKLDEANAMLCPLIGGGRPAKRPPQRPAMPGKVSASPPEAPAPKPPLQDTPRDLVAALEIAIDEATAAREKLRGLLTSPAVKVGLGAVDDGDTIKRMGDFIRERRKQLGLTLESLSALTRFSKPYLSLIETGKSLASSEKLDALAKALELPTGSLAWRADLLRSPASVRAMLTRLMGGQRKAA